MSLVTVIGASSRTFAVTVDGTHAFRLRERYENAINNSTVGGGTGLPTLPGVSRKAMKDAIFTVPVTGSMTVGGGYGHVDNKMLTGITTTSTVSGSSVVSAVGKVPATVAAGTAVLAVGGSSSSMAAKRSAVNVSTLSGPVMGIVKTGGGYEAAIGDGHNDPDDFHKHNNFTFDTTNGTVSGDWDDTISAVGDPKVYPEKSGNVSVGGSLAFIGRAPVDNTGKVADTAANNTAPAGNTAVSSVSDAAYPVGLSDQDAGLLDALSLDELTGDKEITKRSIQDDHSGLAALSDSLDGGVTRGGLLASTVSGGSGESDIFDFVHGSAGNYTIADFGKAAGNKVKQNGTSKILFDDSLYVATGASTLTLDDGTKITFSGMIDGKSIIDDEFSF